MSNTILKIDGKEINLTPPQASETKLGGIKAKAKTTESVEVSIDTTTGKLYVPDQEGATEEQAQQIEQNTQDINLISEDSIKKAPGIIETASGEQILLKDSSDNKLRGLRIYGKSEQIQTTGAQLLDKDTFFIDPPTTISSVKYYSMQVEDGAYTLSSNVPIENGVANLFILSGNVTSGANTTLNGVWAEHLHTVDTMDGYITLGLRTSHEQNINNPLNFNIMLNAGSSALPWEPYTGGQPSPSTDYPQEIKTSGEDGSISVNVYGGNLLNLRDQTLDGNGLSVNISNGIISINGTQTGVGYNNTIASFTARQKFACTLSYDKNFENSDARLIYTINKGPYINADQNPNIDLKEGDMLNVNLRISTESPIDGFIIKPMLSTGSVALPWEPYKPLQTLPISTPNGLPGIPVKSGGNYTDETGQQWLCDVRDEAAGKYTQNIVKLENIQFINKGVTSESRTQFVFSNLPKNSISADVGLSNKFICKDVQIPGTFVAYRTSLYVRFPVGTTLEQANEAMNGAVFYYAATDPDITNIPAEEMEAYKTLHSNYPNTNIFIDDVIQPGIEVDYTADTKMYIDNKFNELAEQILNNVGGN